MGSTSKYFVLRQGRVLGLSLLQWYMCLHLDKWTYAHTQVLGSNCQKMLLPKLRCKCDRIPMSWVYISFKSRCVVGRAEREERLSRNIVTSTWVTVAWHLSCPSSGVLTGGVLGVFFWRHHFYTVDLPAMHRTEMLLPQLGLAGVQGLSSFLMVCHGENFCLDVLPTSASAWHLPIAAFCTYCKFPQHSGVLSSVLIPNLHLSLGLELTLSCLPSVSLVLFLMGTSFSDSVLRYFTAFFKSWQHVCMYIQI